MIAISLGLATLLIETVTARIFNSQNNNWNQLNESRDINNSNQKSYKKQIKWSSVISIFVLHSIFSYYMFNLLTLRYSFSTYMFMFAYGEFTGLAITAGAHRLWTHKSYKANLPLRIFLMMFQSAAMQNNIFNWVRDHRVHHKFTDTDADPHNSTRGFFFSHCGWLMCKKHPEVIKNGQKIDMSDILADPVVKFQLKYYYPLAISLGLVIPIALHMYILGGPLLEAVITRIAGYVISLNFTWSVNSAAHLWGMKPYDKTIRPSENKLVSVIAMGEGSHNYHHVFPWDYKTSELGANRYNVTTAFLDLMSLIGWATDLKTATTDMIKHRAAWLQNISIPKLYTMEPTLAGTT